MAVGAHQEPVSRFSQQVELGSQVRISYHGSVVAGSSTRPRMQGSAPELNLGRSLGETRLCSDDGLKKSMKQSHLTCLRQIQDGLASLHLTFANTTYIESEPIGQRCFRLPTMSPSTGETIKRTQIEPSNTIFKSISTSSVEKTIVIAYPSA